MCYYLKSILNKKLLKIQKKKFEKMSSVFCVFWIYLEKLYLYFKWKMLKNLNFNKILLKKIKHHFCQKTKYDRYKKP